MWPFDGPKEKNPIEEIETDHKSLGSLVCLKCGETPPTLLNVEGLYYCETCYVAMQRIERWNNEEAEWSKPTEEKK
jgi:hypothetical protein